MCPNTIKEIIMAIPPVPPGNYSITSSPTQGLGVEVSRTEAEKTLDSMSPSQQSAIYAQAEKDTAYSDGNIRQAAIESVKTEMTFAAEKDAGLS